MDAPRDGYQVGIFFSLVLMHSHGPSRCWFGRCDDLRIFLHMTSPERGAGRALTTSFVMFSPHRASDIISP